MREHIAELLNIESAGLLTCFGIFSYAFYLIFLKKLNEHRHRLLKRLLKEGALSFLGFASLFATHYFLSQQGISPITESYIGVATLVMGGVYVVKICKVVVFEYLFLSSMRSGVPVLLVDLVTLVISMFIAAWILTSVFQIRLAPLLATSALLSVVLGLALQETLGNLFAGVALQFDKPYEIGDWIEVHGEKEVVVGEVHEISWRATVMTGFFDEVITIPNRLVAQSQVSNFSSSKKCIYRMTSLFLDSNADADKVKSILEGVLKQVSGVVQTQTHFVLLRELNEKGMHWRMVYPVHNYGQQYITMNEILLKAQSEFRKHGVQVARVRIDASASVQSPQLSPQQAI